MLVVFVSRRSTKTAWLIAFVVCDVLSCAILLGIIATFSRAGLPIQCGGMTQDRQFSPKRVSHTFHLHQLPADPNRIAAPGYTTIGFSDEGAGHRGELDAFCGFDRSYFAIANTLMSVVLWLFVLHPLTPSSFVNIFTITTTVLRIFEKKYTKTTKVNELLESLERADEINMKVLDAPSPLASTASLNLPPPSSEGILTRNTSLRSNFTTATASTTGPYTPGPIYRRPVHTNPPPLPRLPSTNPPAAAAFTPIPFDEEDPEADAAHVADGMQHRHHQPFQNHHQPFHHQRNPSFPRMPPLSEESSHPNSPSAQRHAAWGMQRQQQQQQQQQHTETDADADADADAALVSDGMRPFEPTLPPYTPGTRRMSGHGGEGDNEMRLSGYVKGQTRAQGMKDSGGF